MFSSRLEALEHAISIYIDGRNPTSSTFKAEHIHECSRRLIHRARGEKPASNSYMSDLGLSCFKNKWLSIFEKIPDINLIASWVDCCDQKRNIVSVVDCIVEFEEIKYCVNFIPMGDKLYKQTKKDGFIKRDVVKITCDMWMTEIYNGIILYENTITGEYSIFRINFVKDVAKEIIKKCDDLLLCFLYDKLPDKIEDRTQCRVCEFNHKCWDEGVI